MTDFITWAWHLVFHAWGPWSAPEPRRGYGSFYQTRTCVLCKRVQSKAV